MISGHPVVWFVKNIKCACGRNFVQLHVPTRNAFSRTRYLPHSLIHYDPRCHLVFISQLLPYLRQTRLLFTLAQGSQKIAIICIYDRVPRTRFSVRHILAIRQWYGVIYHIFQCLCAKRPHFYMRSEIWRQRCVSGSRFSSWRGNSGDLRTFKAEIGIFMFAWIFGSFVPK